MNVVLEEKIIERLHALDEPKLVEVLDFVEFLAERRRLVADGADGQNEPAISFYEATREDCGMIAGGPDDVSCNRDYLQGFGE